MIEATDIKKYLSGGADNSDPNASLGGIISTTEVVDDTINNLFALANAAEAEAGSTKYRAIFIKNTHATLTLTDPKVYISSNTPSADTSVEIALADETGSPIEIVGNENTAPSGPVFSSPSSFATGLSLGSLAPGESKGIWIKWIIGEDTIAVNDTVTLSIKGETEN